jgi:hypothetical protein
MRVYKVFQHNGKTVWIIAETFLGAVCKYSNITDVSNLQDLSGCESIKSIEIKFDDCSNGDIIVDESPINVCLVKTVYDNFFVFCSDPITAIEIVKKKFGELYDNDFLVSKLLSEMNDQIIV